MVRRRLWGKVIEAGCAGSGSGGGGGEDRV